MSTRRRFVVSLIVSTSVFLALVVAVSQNWLTRLDAAILSGLRQPDDMSNPLGPPWIEETAADLTALGGYPIIVLVAFIALTILFIRQHNKLAFYLLFSLVGGSLISTGLKLFFARPRPDIVGHLDRVFTSSFPSAHAMVSMLAWLAFALVAARLMRSHHLERTFCICALLIAIVAGCTRIYLGVHWPTDVLAGWATGIAWTCICWLTADRLGFWQRPA